MLKIIVASIVVSSSLLIASENIIPSFSDFDTNRDAKITKEEFEKIQTHRMKYQSESTRMISNVDNNLSFENMDTNHDSFISTTEFSEHQALYRAKVRASRDKN